jgi:hypothetical protein
MGTMDRVKPSGSGVGSVLLSCDGIAPMGQPVCAIEPRLLTLRNAIAIYGISRSEWYRRHEAGQITLRKVNGRTMILVAEAEELLKSLPAVPRGGRVATDQADVQK